MESLKSPKKQSTEPVLKSRQKPGTKSSDVKIASFFHDVHTRKGLAFFRLDSTWENAKTMSPEKWYDMYIKPNHPELAELEMRVL